MSVLVAMLIVAGATVLGVIFTLMAGQDPGVVLGVFVIIGSLAATLGIRRRAVYLLFPLPALALFLGALLAGVVHDSQLASSTAGWAGSLQWFAGIFFPMVVGTVLVLLAGGGRWLFGSQLVTGRGPLPAGWRQRRARPAPHRAPAAPRRAIRGPPRTRSPSATPAPARCRGQAPARHHGRARDRHHGKVPARHRGRARDRHRGKARDRHLGRAPVRHHGQAPVPRHSRAQARHRGKARARHRGKAPGRPRARHRAAPKARHRD